MSQNMSSVAVVIGALRVNPFPANIGDILLYQTGRKNPLVHKGLSSLICLASRGGPRSS